MDFGVRQELIPIISFFEQVFGLRLPVECFEDNEAAEKIMRKGYSQQLRYAARTQRLCIGLLGDFFADTAGLPQCLAVSI